MWPLTDLRTLLSQERADLAGFLATLTPQQWQAPTLCGDWRVRDVVAHVICYDDLGPRALLPLVVRGRLRVSRINAAALSRYAGLGPQQLLELLADNPRPRRLPARLGGRVGLAETLIHHQDIRRGLGQPRSIPAERLAPALRTAMIGPDIAGPWRVRGIRLTATDIAFTAGAGQEIQGPAEALLMAIAGRRAALSELSGPGRARLARRIGG